MSPPRVLHRAAFFPVQLVDGSTHVIGPGGRVVRTFTHPDTTVRWMEAKRMAAGLNAGRHRRSAEVRVRWRWLVIILVVIGVLAWFMI